MLSSMIIQDTRPDFFTFINAETIHLSLNIVTDGVCTLLATAAKYGRLNYLEKLLQAGADIDLLDSAGNTALIVSAQFHQQMSAALLVRKGATIDIRNNAGHAALMISAQHGHQDILRYLLNAGANVELQNAHGATALMLAIVRGHGSCASALLESGANVDARDGTRTTALIIAASHDTRFEGDEVCEWCNETCLNEPTCGMCGNERPLRFDRVELLTLLIAAGADINAQDVIGNNALMGAAQQQHIGAIVLLLEAGANQDLRRRNGTTFAELAAVKNPWIPDGLSSDERVVKARSVVPLVKHPACSGPAALVAADPQFGAPVAPMFGAPVAPSFSGTNPAEARPKATTKNEKPPRASGFDTTGLTRVESSTKWRTRRRPGSATGRKALAQAGRELWKSTFLTA
jgi:serine/threonine-protein phosphatase 6 regulatory ankyrin repeat subunit B